METNEKVYPKAIEQSVEMGNFDHNFLGGDRNLIIFTEASGVVEPGESTFHQAGQKMLCKRGKSNSQEKMDIEGTREA